MKAVRQQAVEFLDQYIHSLPDKETPQDSEIDDAARAVLGQPIRPGGRRAYVGLFRDAPLVYLRRQAVDCIDGRLQSLNNQPHATDNVIDALIRSLLKLPKRTTQKVYEGIQLDSLTMAITAEQLYAIAPYADPDQIDRLLPHINKTLKVYKINTRLRQAHFLAQIAHESDNFNALEEYASGEDYEHRSDLGNVKKGDGVLFKGRGLIMVTGRDNYREVGEALGIDFISNPKALSDEQYAALSAGWFWDREDLNDLADKDDLDGITEIINGGWNGLKDRAAKLLAAKKVFKLV